MENLKFQINDIVKLNGCPFDEQIAEEVLLYAFLKDKEMRVTMVMVPDEEGTSGLWIRTDMIPDWTDAAWFEKV